VGSHPHHRRPHAPPARLAEAHDGHRLCIALGLFTRFWAAAATIEMAVIVYHHLPKFGWTERGYEYPLMWGLIMLAIALRGGGPYSLDRKIGREL
jgi:putative oxidoreductase